MRGGINNFTSHGKVVGSTDELDGARAPAEMSAGSRQQFEEFGRLMLFAQGRSSQGEVDN